MLTITTPSWKLGPAAHEERLLDENGEPELALLRHPTQPFGALLSSIASNPTALWDDVRRVADAYLLAVTGGTADLDPRLEQARRWAAEWAASPGKPGGFGWLPIGWNGADQLDDPRGSFEVRRLRLDGTGFDRSLVLMAGNRRPDFGDGVDTQHVGLRIVMHLAPAAQADTLDCRVSGLSCSGLARAMEPFDPAKLVGPSALTVLQEALDPVSLAVPWTLDLLQRRAGGLLDLSAGSVTISGISLAADHLRVTGGGARDIADGRRGYEWCLSLDKAAPTTYAGTPSWSARAEWVEQCSDAAAAPRLFLRDAASAGSAATLAERSVTSDAARLDPLRQRCGLPPLLKDPDGRFQVMQSRIADFANKPEQVQSVDPGRLPLRSDDLAAAHAFRRGRELFSRLGRYGFWPQAYFRFASLPLVLRHRAGFDARPDGNTVNAQVRLDGAPIGWLGSKPLERPRLEVCFGAANLRHRELQPNGSKSLLTAQPLGAAADPRLAWHEFGHVLGHAATDALELGFAHSIGDALAAVIADPASALADGPDSPQRGRTFPWIPIGRSHDRQRGLGWCWCGPLNTKRRARHRFPALLYSDYTEEQLLSSSIFRLYRALGGDTFGGDATDDRQARERASNSVVYLLLRAMALLGPEPLVPVRSADAMVSALIDADIGTSAQLPVEHAGGTLHKVIRWAFERQGLYATADPKALSNEPGLPPPVDLWIADRRSVAPDGSYTPVPLRWSDTEAQGWHAEAQSLRRVGDELHVRVNNRGTAESGSVAVKAWLGSDDGSGGIDWEPFGDATLAQIGPGGSADAVITPPVAWPAPPLWLLVQADGAEDRANLEPASGLPCATSQPPAATAELLDLVAHDNNLALALVTGS